MLLQYQVMYCGSTRGYADTVPDDVLLQNQLSYGHTSSSLNKDHMLGSKNKLKDSKLDWQKSGEGFDGLDLTKKKHSEISLINQGIPTKKSNQQGNFGICWSSSEEEGDDDNKLNMPHKDKKKKTPRKIRSKQKSTRAKRRKFESCFTMSFEPNEEDIDISDSDSELSTSDKSVQGVSPDQKAKKLNVADSVDILVPDIESEDSRSESNPQPQPSHPSSPSSSSHLSPDISGASSLSQASLSQHQPSQRSKVKASEWVKSLDLKTPTKDMQSCSPPVTDDSSKKKKKYQRGGLADQLSRLLMREKSSVRMWSHQQKTSTHIQESSKTVTVKIESFEEMYSLQLSRCTVMDDISICNVMEEMTENDENLLVMFSPSNSALSDLQAGSVVTISAPWQQLELKQTGVTVLLCTHFCQIEDNTETENKEKKKNKLTTTLLTWDCPCTSGLVKDHKSCPAFLYPCVPGLVSSRDSKEGTCSAFVNPSKGESSLHLIKESHRILHSSVVTSSLLESIEKHKQEENIGLCFRARIQRVHRRRSQLKSQDCWSLLTEDGHGTVSEILLPDNAEEKFGNVLLNGESNTYTFTGLGVYNRTTRDRDEDLFSVIDKVWSGLQVNKESQDSENINELQCKTKHHHLTNTEAPGFCYILTEDVNCHDGLQITESKTQISKYNRFQPIQLSDISGKKEERVSFIAKLIYMCNKDFDKPSSSKMMKSKEPQPSSSKGMKSQEPQLMYVSDRSVLDTNKPYRMLNIGSSCSLTDLDNLQDCHIIYFRDVYIADDDNLYCDCYTRIINLKSIEKEKLSFYDINQKQLDITISQMTQMKINLLDDFEDCKIGHLCSISGVITGVDESKAYSWEVCDKCASDKLSYRENAKELTCLGCNLPIQDPVTMMKMEVVVKDQNKNFCYTIDLLQSTIESLLPTEDADEEGYELSCVLQKEIGPLNCIVRNISTDKKDRNNIKNIDLKEITLIP